MKKENAPITEFDESKAKKYFVLYKFLEIFGLFLFFVGFYGLGFFVASKFPVFVEEYILQITGTYWNLWFIGFGFLCMLLVVLVVIYLGGYLIYHLTKLWIKGNWWLAKRKAEAPRARKKRKEEQVKIDLYNEIEGKERDRKRYGYCVGDEATYINKDDNATNGERYGQKCIVGEIDSDGDPYPLWEDGSEGGEENDYVFASSFKFKKKPLPKKPKLK